VRVSCSSHHAPSFFAAPRERPHCFCHPDPVVPAREPEPVRDPLPAGRSGGDHLQRL